MVYQKYQILSASLPQYYKEFNSTEHLIDSPFNLLALAQHFGLPTRLIDCSLNPLVALFFAVHENPHENGIIYCYHSPENFLFGSELDFGIKKLAESLYSEELVQGLHSHARASSFAYRILATGELDISNLENSKLHFRNHIITPHNLHKRMVSQKSIFSISNKIEYDFEKEEDDKFNKILVKSKSKKPIIKELEQAGIISSFIYPSLENFCGEIKKSLT